MGRGARPGGQGKGRSQGTGAQEPGCLGAAKGAELEQLVWRGGVALEAMEEQGWGARSGEGAADLDAGGRGAMGVAAGGEAQGLGAREKKGPAGGLERRGAQGRREGHHGRGDARSGARR